MCYKKSDECDSSQLSPLPLAASSTYEEILKSNTSRIEMGKYPIKNFHFFSSNIYRQLCYVTKPTFLRHIIHC